MDSGKDVPDRDAPPPTVPHEPPTRRTAIRLLLGDCAQQRVRVARALTSMLVYVVCLGLAEYCRIKGMADPTLARLLQGGMALWMMLVYAVLRSGFNLRFPDPSLTFVQIMAAGAWIAAAYIVFAPVRGSLLMLLSLTLVFGIFNLDRNGRRIYNAVTLIGTGFTMFVLAHVSPDTHPPDVELAHFILIATTLPVMSMLSAQLVNIRSRLRAQRNELKVALARIRELATRDELTGLPNRRHANELFAHMVKRAERSQSPVTVCVLDLDHFKRVNDTFGHNAGDEVLRRFAEVSAGALRESDVLARWGGEEFIVLLPDTPAIQAGQTIERVRQTLAGIRMLSATAGNITFSAGLAQYRPGESMEHTVERADFALYRAKSEGRDRSVISD